MRRTSYVALAILALASSTFAYNLQLIATGQTSFPARDSFTQVTLVGSNGVNTAVVAGGANRGTKVAFNDIWISSPPDSGVWTQVVPVANYTPRYDHCTVVLTTSAPGVIVMMGGDYYNGTGSTAVTTSQNDVWASSDGGVTWTRKTSAAPWSPRKALQCAAWGNTTQNADGSFVRDTIVLVGGLIMPGAAQGVVTTSHANDVWISRDVGATWTSLPPASFGPRADGVLQFIGLSSLLLMGGENNPPMVYNDVWRSDNGGYSWYFVANASWKPRFQFTTCRFPPSIVVIGGRVCTGAPGCSGLSACACNQIGEMWATNDAITWQQVPLAFNGFGNKSDVDCDRFTSSSGTGIIISGGRSTQSDTNDVYVGYGPFFPTPVSAAQSFHSVCPALSVMFVALVFLISSTVLA